MPIPHTPDSPHLPDLAPPGELSGGAGHPRQLVTPEAAVLIALVLSVTMLSWYQRPIPVVLTALCATAATMLLPIRVVCLTGRCGAGQG
ncbi:hypothetical protein ABT224_20405 [Streptomyces sp. NPDC001584]|uniref:hypothetical protein n=1 Tax=Streptomyces sp. NPDC001584 TaxID=3154521 RepID=UPI00331938FA